MLQVEGRGGGWLKSSGDAMQACRRGDVEVLSAYCLLLLKFLVFAPQGSLVGLRCDFRDFRDGVGETNSPISSTANIVRN